MGPQGLPAPGAGGCPCMIMLSQTTSANWSGMCPRVEMPFPPDCFAEVLACLDTQQYDQLVFPMVNVRRVISPTNKLGLPQRKNSTICWPESTRSSGRLAFCCMAMAFLLALIMSRATLRGKVRGPLVVAAVTLLQRRHAM